MNYRRGLWRNLIHHRISMVNHWYIIYLYNTPRSHARLLYIIKPCLSTLFLYFFNIFSFFRILYILTKTNAKFRQNCTIKNRTDKVITGSVFRHIFYYKYLKYWFITYFTSSSLEVLWRYISCFLSKFSSKFIASSSLSSLKVYLDVTFFK